MGTIVVDSVYTPVRDVGYKVELTRVGDITNYEKLTVSVETNGTLSPAEAFNQTTQILMDHFGLILSATAGAVAELPVREVAPAKESAEETTATEEIAEEATEEKKPKVKKAKKK